MHSIWVLTRRSITKNCSVNTGHHLTPPWRTFPWWRDTWICTQCGSLNGRKTAWGVVHHVDPWWHEAKTWRLRRRLAEWIGFTGLKIVGVGRHHRGRTGVGATLLKTWKRWTKRKLSQYCLKKCPWFTIHVVKVHLGLPFNSRIPV